MVESTTIFLDTFQKIDKAHRRYFQIKFAGYGFTPNEILVLLFLYNNAPEYDTATDIARSKGVSKGMIARSVDSLCEKNYLEAVRDKHDRRIIHLRLKDEHNQLAARIEGLQKEFVKELGKGISDEDINHTKNTLCQLLKNAELLLDRRICNGSN